MLQAELKRPQDLTAADRAGWMELAASTPAFASPLLGPGFAELVGRVRADARVALYRRGTELVGVLAHHRRPMGLGRPIGAPWSDVHALITPPDAPLDWREALGAAGLRAFRFAHLLDPHGVFADAPSGEETDHAVVTGPDGDVYWERLRAGSPKRFKNIRRLEHKLEREAGLLELGPDRSREAFDQLLAWKREQFRRTGAQDVLHPEWSLGLIEAAFAARGGELEGLMITLRAAGRLVAGHFGVRAGEVFHPWIAAYDPAFVAYSPGVVFLSMAVRRAPEFGVTRYELSSGSDGYKLVFASEARTLLHGSADLRAAGSLPEGARLLERVRRRLDHIAEAEITLGGRLQGVAAAMASARLRLSPTHNGEPA